MFSSSIPSFCSIESNDMPQNNEPSKNTSEITKDEINTIVNSEALQKAIKDSHDAWEKTKFKWQIFVALVMALSAALGYYLKWDSDRKDLIEQQIQAANERKAEQIQAEINLKMEWMRRTNNAIKDMRKTRALIIIGCKYQRPISMYNQEVERFLVRDQVARNFDGVMFIFNNSVQKKVSDLINFDESINNVCSTNAPSDDQWHKYENEISILMENSITQDEQTLSIITKNTVN